MISFTCKCKYNIALLNVDIILLIALGVIAFGIFDIYYATSIAEYNSCTLTNINDMLIAAGCVYIFFGICITIECVWMHIEIVAHFADSDYIDKAYKQFNGIIIPETTMLFIFTALLDFGIMFTGLIFIASEKSCHDTPYILLIINLFVIGLLPLTLIVLAITIMSVPIIIYYICYVIYSVTNYICKNANNICCFEIITNTQKELPMHTVTNSNESKC